MLDQKIIDGLDLAFNEATLLGVEINTEKRVVALTIAGVCLDGAGNIPEDRRVQVILKSVSRLCTSLRNGRWDDPNAKVVTFPQEDLLRVIQEFQGLPIYGWKFFDRDEGKFSEWEDRLSLNYVANNIQTSNAHTLDLFQDSTSRILDIRIWFDDLEVFTPDYKEVPLNEFIAAAKRGWDAIMLDGNKDVQNYFCIYPSA